MWGKVTKTAHGNLVKHSRQKRCFEAEMRATLEADWEAALKHLPKARNLWAQLLKADKLVAERRHAERKLQAWGDSRREALYKGGVQALYHDELGALCRPGKRGQQAALQLLFPLVDKNAAGTVGDAMNKLIQAAHAELLRRWETRKVARYHAMMTGTPSKRD